MMKKKKNGMQVEKIRLQTSCDRDKSIEQVIPKNRYHVQSKKRCILAMMMKKGLRKTKRYCLVLSHSVILI